MSEDASTTTYVLVAFLIGLFATVISANYVADSNSPALTAGEPDAIPNMTIGAAVTQIPSNVLGDSIELGDGPGAHLIQFSENN